MVLSEKCRAWFLQLRFLLEVILKRLHHNCKIRYVIGLNPNKHWLYEKRYIIFSIKIEKPILFSCDSYMLSIHYIIKIMNVTTIKLYVCFIIFRYNMDVWKVLIVFKKRPGHPFWERDKHMSIGSTYQYWNSTNLLNLLKVNPTWNRWHIKDQITERV